MADTPSRELLARGFQHAREWGASETVVPMLAAFAQAEIARLAAKQSNDGVREATIEECAKTAETSCGSQRDIAARIRVFSPGAPTP